MARTGGHSSYHEPVPTSALTGDLITQHYSETKMAAIRTEPTLEKQKMRSRPLAVDFLKI